MYVAPVVQVQFPLELLLLLLLYRETTDFRISTTIESESESFIVHIEITYDTHIIFRKHNNTHIHPSRSLISYSNKHWTRKRHSTPKTQPPPPRPKPRCRRYTSSIPTYVDPFLHRYHLYDSLLVRNSNCMAYTKEYINKKGESILKLSKT